MSSNNGDANYLFAGSGSERPAAGGAEQFWKVLIADDEPEVHDITKLVLKRYEYNGRGLRFLSAYSGEETLDMLNENPDCAVLFLDVVMETDDAGLRVANLIRNSLQNRNIRIVLRTGQPGQAPEQRVIMEYDINDYKEKTELTSQKLFTTITSALRSYQDIHNLDQNRAGLAQIISAANDLFTIQSLERFASHALEQLVSLLHETYALSKQELHGCAIIRDDEHKLRIFSGYGSYQQATGLSPEQALPMEQLEMIRRVMQERNTIIEGKNFAGFIRTQNRDEGVLLLSSPQDLRTYHIDMHLVDIYLTNLAIAMDNNFLTREINETQRDIINMLGEIVESKSKETANHVRRVGEYVHIFARGCGVAEPDLELMQMAALMHDVGKIGIPDSILQKPGKLTEEEMDIMRRHADIGFNILKSSKRRILREAAKIAKEHHEWWNGQGYPVGLKGENISLSGRITALADVFDALCHNRVYKKAMPVDEVVTYINDSSGKQFDPNLVRIFNERLDELLEIQRLYPDVAITHDWEKKSAQQQQGRAKQGH
jgi:response regulator RpfG family c-di-GMP phosphodiesterase